MHMIIMCVTELIEAEYVQFFVVCACDVQVCAYVRERGEEGERERKGCVCEDMSHLLYFSKDSKNIKSRTVQSFFI